MKFEICQDYLRSPDETMVCADVVDLSSYYHRVSKCFARWVFFFPLGITVAGIGVGFLPFLWLFLLLLLHIGTDCCLDVMASLTELCATGNLTVATLGQLLVLALVTSM